MKRGSLIALSLLVCLTALAPAVFGQQQPRTSQFQTVVLESFDDPAESRWIARGSRFTTEGFPQYGYLETWPNALYRVAPEGVELRSFGIQGAFDRMGYNYVEFIPVEAENDEDGNPVVRGIPVPGQAQSIDVWAWGSNLDYYLELHVRDFRGIVHVLPLGSLNYLGWRNLRTAIPSAIPQRSTVPPNVRSLEIVKLVMWTNPGETVSGFYLYLDEMKAFTDVFQAPFDGENLAVPEAVNDLWENAQGTSEGGN